MLDFLNTYILGPAVPVLLFSAGLFFLFRFKGFYILHPIKTFRAMLSPSGKSGKSQFRATMMALAGTLGVGNIVGVASAIAVGGYGSVFWMLVSAAVAMSLKYCEAYLAVRHRRYDSENNRFYGGAVYYIKDILSKAGHSKLGGLISVTFALFCILNAFTMGCVIQVNSVSHAVGGEFGLPLWASGAVIGVVCLICLAGGALWIAKTTEKLIPVMSVAYLVISLAVIFKNPAGCVQAIKLIIEDAFKLSALGGGVLGFVFSKSLRIGCMRGLLSNEAGCGTAPIAHASSDTDSSHRQGLWGIFEVFCDTVLLCTVTALVIIIGRDFAQPYHDNPIMMATRAYSGLLGEWAGWLLTVSIVIFGFATVICWGHYGSECVRFLPIKHKTAAVAVFSVLYSATAVVGAVVAPNSVWTLADFALGVMTVINVPILLMGEYGVR